MPKYKVPETQLAETSEPTDSIDPEINKKLRVNLFSQWADDATKNIDNTADKSGHNNIVNYSTSDVSSEVEMLDSSTAHIEY